MPIEVSFIRSRYNNHLDPNLCRDSWTFEEEKRLYQLHDDYGNKWAVISHKLGQGRYHALKIEPITASKIISFLD